MLFPIILLIFILTEDGAAFNHWT